MFASTLLTRVINIGEAKFGTERLGTGDRLKPDEIGLRTLYIARII